MSTNKLKQKYALIEKIQEGSYGIVYKARNNQTKQIYAVKIFKSFGKIGLPISFIRQRYIHQIIESKYLVKVIEIFIQEKDPAIVMQWLDISLDQAITSIKIIKIKQVFLQILKALQEFHNNGVIHRDLKPSNIMLARVNVKQNPLVCPQAAAQEEYTIRIIDYGMAKELPLNKSNMTNQVGSLFFRAPQLLLGGTVYGQQIDIWSLGCIFYYMLTGHTIFKATNQIDQFNKIKYIVGINRANILNQPFLINLNKLKIQDCQSHWQEIKHKINQLELDLLQKMISLDPYHRPKIQQLLSHPYFH